MKKLMLFIVSMMLFVGCFWDKIDIPKEIDGNAYMLQNVISGSEVTMGFKDGTLSGNAGVNRYFATYRIENDDIEISGLGSTKMMGSKELNNQENLFFKDLGESKKILVIEDKMVLITSSGKKLKFMKKE